MLDSHCHLNHADLYDDVTGVIARATAAGVVAMVTVGYDLESSVRAVEIAGANRSVWGTVGIHPHDAHAYSDAARSRLRELADDPRVVAIGEIGLDYHYDFSPRDAQITAFEAQLDLAEEVGLPVVVHCREAHDDGLAILSRRIPGRGGVMHCWSGSLDEAYRAVSMGLLIGVAGVITFKNRGCLGDVVRSVPLEALLIETDAPYLAPVPHRGRRNEPSYLPYVCERVAEERGMLPSAIAELTTANATRLFHRLRL